MNKLLALLVTFIVAAGIAKAQVEVPKEMMFADIKLILNEDARKHIKSNADALVRNPRYFQLKVDRADAYFHIVDKVFAEEGIPFDFRYLILQESGLVSDAVSTSNAVGFWQFKKASGEEVGLRINDSVDERMHIAASTLGAAKYLNRNNNHLQNWLFTLLSYYAGLSGAKSVVDAKLFGAKELELDASTHWYILKFLAHKVAFENAIGKNPTPPFRVMEYKDCTQKSLKEIAEETNLEFQQVKDYNKWLKANRVPADKTYTVLLPVKLEQQPEVIAQIVKPAPASTPETNPEIKPWPKQNLFSLFKKDKQKPQAAEEYKSDAPIFFVWNNIKAIQAKKGDTSTKLALQAGITREEFLDYNDMKLYDAIVPGQVYYVKKKKRKAKVPYHVVKEGETLWDISQAYGVRLNVLMAKNRLKKPEKLKEGRVLWLRHIRPATTEIEYRKVEKPVATVAVKSNAASAAPANVSTSASQQPVTVSAKSTESAAPEAGSKPVVNDSRQVTAPVSEKALEEEEEEEDEMLENVNQLVAEENQAIELANNHIAAANPVQANKAAGQAAVSAPPATRAEPATPTSSVPTKKEAPVSPTKTSPAAAPVVTTAPAATTNAENAFTKHVVEAGQTLFAISKLYEVPIDSIKQWNNLQENSLRYGQVLLVKQNSNEVVQSTPTAVSLPQTNLKKVYEVKPGDTLYKIAREHGVSINELKEWNNKSDFNVAIGEHLVIQK